MCTGSTTETVLLANTAPFLLTLAANKADALLRLSDNELTLIANSLQISACAHFV